MANRLNVVLAIDTSPLERGLNRAQVGLEGFARRMESVGRDLSTRLTLPLIAGGAAAVSVAAKYETLQTSLSTLLGSAEEGGKAFERLAEFAARTPFQLEDVAAGAKQLLAFGLSIDQVYDSLSFLGDIAGATGSNLQDLTLIFGQARSIGAAYTQDLRQLAERGVPVFDLLSKKTGLTGDALRKFIEQGKVTFPLLQELLKSTAQEGGLFFGGMEAQSRTLAGVFSTFKDNVQLALAQIGNAIAEAIDLRAVMGRLSDAVQRAADWFGKLSPEVRKGIVIFGLAVAAIGPVLFALGSVAKVTALAVAGFKSLLIATKATAIFFASGLLNPITLVVAAIAALVAGVLYAYSRFEGFRRIINGLGAAIKEIITIFREAGAAFFEGFANLKEGDFKKANENFKKAFTAGIPTEFARQYGKRVKDAFGEGFADDTDFVKKGLADLKASIAGATGIAGGIGGNAAATAPTAAPTTPGDPAEPLKRTVAVLDELTPRMKLNREETLKSFVALKGLQGAYTALQISIGEVDPAQLQFDAQAANAQVFTDALAKMKTGLTDTYAAGIARAQEFSLWLADNGLKINELGDRVVDFGAAMESALLTGIQSFTGEIQNGISGFKELAKSIATAAKNIIKTFIQIGVTGLVKNILAGPTGAALGPVALAIAGAAGAAASALFSSLIGKIKAPALARGGLVTGETLAVVGDNPSGKEAIIPFERMGEFLNKFGGGAMRVTGVFEVKGQDLILVLDRAQQQQQRIR